MSRRGRHHNRIKIERMSHRVYRTIASAAIIHDLFYYKLSVFTVFVCNLCRVKDLEKVNNEQEKCRNCEYNDQSSDEISVVSVEHQL